jgi:peptidoglycan hydrolase-like protein with peptidoglycan-binding domain
MLGFLRSTVEENASVDTADMKPLKKNLGSLGYYRPTEGVDLHDYPDEPLFKGIRKFQKDEGLKVDGVMKPGGPTENRLLKRVSERREKPYGSERLEIVSSDEMDRRKADPNNEWYEPPKTPQERQADRKKWRHGKGKTRKPLNSEEFTWEERWDQVRDFWEGPKIGDVEASGGVRNGRTGN